MNFNEDCGIVEDTEYNRSWLDAMMFIKHKLAEFNDDGVLK